MYTNGPLFYGSNSDSEIDYFERYMQGQQWNFILMI